VNASSDYAPIPGTDPPQYVQKTYTANLLRQIVSANKDVLSGLRVSQSHNLAAPLQPKATLRDLAERGATDPDVAWPVLQALWSELTTSAPKGSNQKRPPVLLTTDGLHHLMRDSDYRSPDFGPIHAHDLALVDLFASHLSGAKPLANGGMVLAAISRSNQSRSDALDYAIERNEYAQDPGLYKTEPIWDPFMALDRRVVDAMSGVGVLRLGGLSKVEAGSVMQYYASSGILRQDVTDGLVAQKWSLSGGGIIGELERSSVVWRM
jgi:small subunit ribosomal protein S29